MKILCFQHTTSNEKTSRMSKLISPKVKSVVKTPMTKSMTSLKDVSNSEVISIYVKTKRELLICIIQLLIFVLIYSALYHQFGLIKFSLKKS